MKSKLFKKIVACAAVVSMAAQFAAVLPASADESDGKAFAYGIDYKEGEISVTYEPNASAKLIVAKYTDGRMSGITSQDVAFAAEGTAVVAKTLEKGDKVFVWKNFSGMEAIMPSYTYEGSNTESTPGPTPTPKPDPTPTLKPDPTPTPKPTIDPALIYYQLDFEDDAKTYLNSKDGYDDSAKEIWISEYYFAGLSIATDSNPDINKYTQYLNNQGKGTRTTFFRLPDDAGKLEDNKSVAEFDFKFHNGGGNGNNQLVLVGDNERIIGNGDYEPGNKPAGTAAILKFTQPKDGGAQFSVNNSATVKSEGYKDNTWAHAKAVMDFGTKSVLITVTSLDGNDTYLPTTQVSMDSDAAKLSILFMDAARDSCSTSIDNIIVRKLTDDDVTDTYYTAAFDVDGVKTNISAKEGDPVESVPATDKTGYIFDGWSKDGDTENLVSTEDVLKAPLTADVTYTAVYHKNPEYIEPMVEVQFSSFPANGLPTAGADADTAESNPIQVKLIGELGNDLLSEENRDERVTDLDVKWEFDGFRTVVSKGEPTTDLNEDEYCDSYAKVVKDAADPTKVDFRLKGQAFNFYGQVKATVTYNGKELTISKPMSILPNTTSAANVILPKAGYVSDFSPLENTMVGYKATTSGDNKSATDIITGDWAAYGGNTGRGLYLSSDDEGANKFLKLKSTGTNSSSFAVNKLSSAPTGQVIIAQDMRFYNANSSVLFKTDNPVTWSNNATSFSLNFTGTAFNLNGGDAICDATTGVWYHIVLSADVTSKLCYAKVYDMEGKLLGSSDVMPFTNAGSTTPTYLCYRTPDNSQGELDFNDVKMYTPEIAGELATTIDNDVLSIPDPENPAAITSANLTVSGTSTEGYDVIGAATWIVEGEPQGITITPDASDSHKAAVTIGDSAQANDYIVKVSMGGKTKDIPIKVSASGDNVAFKTQTKSISIPLTEGAVSTAEYKAQVQDKTNTVISGGENVTYAVYDKNNTTDITNNLPTGITFSVDASTHVATLSVSSTAKATVLYIRATGQNSAEPPETISNSVKVDVHGLAFDFGTSDSGAVAESYTAVTPTSSYSDANGYGISSGTPTAGGTADAADPDADNLAGTFTFQAKVEKAKVYNVTINYSGKIASEAVNKDLTGVELTNDNKAAVTYEIPVIDDILDLTFTNATVSSIVIEKQADKQPGGKPHIYTVGDSTIANNGSWAYVMARDYADYDTLPNLATFSNNGRGGKNLGSYYTGGEFRDRVLKNIKPGDYVMIGDMGTNGMGSEFEASFNYYIDACEALGAKIILNSYSPHGAVGDYKNCYSSETHTFEGYRKDAYDNTVRAIYAERTDKNGEKYDEKIVGFVDIGKMADAAFNAYVAEGADDTVKEERAQEIIKCFGDHNHYSSGALAAQLMILGHGDGADAKGIVKSLVEILTADLAD